VKTFLAAVIASALSAVVGCTWFPGPRYPPAEMPLVEETPKTIELTAACRE
jgi:hypothetical protein